MSFSGTEVTFSPTSIQIPSDANKQYSNTGTNKIVIYDQTVTATSSLCHYSSVTWTSNSAVSYSCTFTPSERFVNFNINQNGTTTPIKRITIKCGESLTISFPESYGGSKYKKCTIKYNNNIVFEYTAKNTHYIESANYSSGTAIHEDTEIIITIKLKSYNVTFG